LSEAEEQKQLFQLIRMNVKKYPDLRYIHSTLNGVKLSIGLASKAKAQGNVSGVWDIIFLKKSRGFNGLMIEMKFGKNGLSKNQKEFKKFYEANGFLCKVCYSSEEAWKVIVDYLEGKQ
jgi:hypothetical protein